MSDLTQGVQCPHCRHEWQLEYNYSDGSCNCPKCNEPCVVEWADHPEGGIYIWLEQQ